MINIGTVLKTIRLTIFYLKDKYKDPFSHENYVIENDFLFRFFMTFIKFYNLKFDGAKLLNDM